MDGNNNKLISYKQKQQSQITQQPREILEEDEYTSTLSHIVTRDYYPSLHTLRRDAAILDARSRGDISSAVAIRRMHRKDEMQREHDWKEEMEEESKALQEEETETSIMPYINHQSNKIQVRSKPRPLKHETITGFHARVTSEDNAEYESVQEEERKDREKKLGIIYSTKEGKEGRLMIEAAMNNTEKEEVVNPYNKASRALMGCDTPIELSSDLYDAAPSTGLRITQDGGEDRKKSAANNGLGRNGLFFQPFHRRLENNPTNTGQLTLTSDGAATSSSGGTFLALENNTNTASSKEDDNNKPDNLLMPPPPARQSSAIVKHGSSIQPPPATNSKTIDDRCQLIEYLPKPAVPDINPPATRFPYQNESRLLAKTSNSLGHAYNRQKSIQSMGSFTEASDTTDLDASPRSLERERAARHKARKRENETFVAMTPLIRHGEGRSTSKKQGGEQSASDEPIMTWGNVKGTPLVLSNSAVDGRDDTSADWEPTRPIDAHSLSSGNDAGSESTPAFDVVDDNRREKLARRAEKKLIERSKTYKGRRRKDDNDDDRSVMSSRSASSMASGTSFKRRESLTPAARALLEASNNAHQSKKQRKLGMFHSSQNSRSRDSFGSSLRMSYTPNRDGDSRRKRKSSSSSSISSLRRAAGGATPRCHTSLK